jgi:hypothetical protein
VQRRARREPATGGPGPARLSPRSASVS